MIPVFQTKFVDTHEHGDCLRASVASLLELPLSGVLAFEEYFETDESWHIPFEEFLESVGFEYVGTKNVDEYYSGYKGHYIVTGVSPRIDSTGSHVSHAVVYCKGELVHDPHFSGEGLITPKHIYMIENKNIGDSNE